MGLTIKLRRAALVAPVALALAAAISLVVPVSARADDSAQHRVTQQIAQLSTPSLLRQPLANSPQTPPPPQDLAQRFITRVFGQNRIETNRESINAATTGFLPNSVVVSARNFPDALSAAPLAFQQKVPLVLASRESDYPAHLPALMVGGAAALPTVGLPESTRLYGEDRYRTSAQVLAKFDSASALVVVDGRNFPDAVTAVGLARAVDAPIALVGGEIITEIRDQIQRLEPKRVYLVGGESVIPETVTATLQNLLPSAQIRRFGGTDRYQTAALVAQSGLFDAGAQPVLAAGNNFPDALSAANLMMTGARPILLAQTHCLPASTDQALTAFNNVATVIGGDAAVAENAWRSSCAAYQQWDEAYNPKFAPYDASGCLPESAKARMKLPPEQRPWCPNGNYHIPVTSITPVGGGATLYPGWNGVKVGIIQHALGLGSRWENLDALTVRAVKALQRRAGLPANGVVDRRTWDAANTGFSFDIDTWQAPIAVSPRASRQQRVEQMVNFALSRQGLPYTWGGAGDGGLGYDCSGLMLQAIYSAGVDPQPINVLHHAEPTYRTSQQLYKDPYLQHVPLSQRQRGDLLFWTSGGVIVHVAMDLGNGTFVEANLPGVRVRNFTTRNPGPILGQVVRPIAEDRPY